VQEKKPFGKSSRTASLLWQIYKIPKILIQLLGIKFIKNK